MSFTRRFSRIIQASLLHPLAEHVQVMLEGVDMFLELAR